MTKTKKKLIIMTAFLCVTVLAFAYGTAAYFSDDISFFASGITSGNLKIELVETTLSADTGEQIPSDGSMRVMPGISVSRSVSVRNRGTLSSYIRIRLLPSITLSERERENAGDIDISLIGIDINEEHWIEKDGFYYYRAPVGAGETTEPLFTEVSFSADMGNMYKGSTAYIEIVTYAVQSGDNGTTVLNAEGWSEVGTGGAP